VSTTSRTTSALAALLGFGCSGVGTTVDRLPRDAAARGYVLLPRPVQLPRSRLTSDCGPESICAVMNYWGKPATLPEISRLLRDPGAPGIFSSDVPILARRMGFKATPLEGSVGRIKAAIDRGVPPVIMVDAGGGNFHFFVVAGYSDAEQVIVCEEYQETKRLIPYEEVETRWEAARHLQLELEPSQAEDDTRAGANLEAEGLFAEAAEHFRRALGAEPEHREARVGLGNCLLALRRPEEALAEYRKALEADPSDPKVLNNMAHLHLELKRDLPEAEGMSDRAVELLQEEFRRERTDTGRETDPVRREFRRERRADVERDLAHALGTLGQARMANGKPGMAISAWQASYDHFPLTEFDARARRLYEVGLAQREVSMPAEARRTLERALQEARDPSLRARIEEALK
jgi:hypothetical protein